MRQLGGSGVFELFIPGLASGTLYKYEIKTRDGSPRTKADPLAFAAERPPATASIVYRSTYSWGDGRWMDSRPTYDPLRSPISIYEVHLGSWMRVPEQDHRSLTYREIAPKLVEHVKRLGFTHIELLPIAEHPYDRSWGYQVTGYYAPTSRYGAPDDFRHFVDLCHQHGIGVILDWVPAHFPKDDHALRRFDGTALYEHEDPRRGEHPDWGTLVFNYGRKEVRSFLLADALYWLDEFHIDGLRVDAVASMLYRDYSRGEGQWVPNERGGREDSEAISLLQAVNEAVRADFPGRFTVAEESTAWPGVTRAVQYGGLGFTFKWNMGWMHDTLGYFSKDPVHRRFHHNEITFAMLYENTERFTVPLSHDEVVHGKGSLLSKMPGDEWQRFANLRLLLGYQFTRPGKKLLFMGTELAPWNEWQSDGSLDWHLAEQPLRAGLRHYLTHLSRLYRENNALWKWDHEPAGFTWIDCEDRENSVLAYLRSSGGQFCVVVLNMTPVPRNDYRVGALVSGEYRVLLSSDNARYGGSGLDTPSSWRTDPIPFHNLPQSVSLRLPPLAALILAPVS
jgi:1,4-alpha-glucan branching enzyme